MTCETEAGLLSGRRVLVVEDEYYIAADLKRALLAADAIVIGPTGVLDEALLLARDGQVEVAILDVGLDGRSVYPLATDLSRMDVPYLFLTGYDGWALPEAFRASPRLAKPVPTDAVLRMLGDLLARTPTG